MSTFAGAEHGQEVSPEVMEDLIKDAGRTPRQRTTLYADARASQIARSFNANELDLLKFT
jgi:FO synthase